MKRTVCFVAVACLATTAACAAADSLPPLAGGRVPQNLHELWGGYDPQKEPLEIQLVRQWQEGDITYRYAMYTVGTFKGRKIELGGKWQGPREFRNLRWEVDRSN